MSGSTRPRKPRSTRVSREILSRWIFGRKKGKSVIRSQHDVPPEKVVSFLDFVQALAIREVRVRHRLPLPRIREGGDEARQRYGIEYPLACRHTIDLFGDRRGAGHGHMLVRRPGDLEGIDDACFQLTGREKGHRMLTPVVEMFLDDLHFDPETGRATGYSPMIGPDCRVVLDPRRRFGEPVVEPGGYTAQSLWHATNTEGGIAEAAAAYGISAGEVLLANRDFDSLINWPVV